jgi:hypothetical protein
MKFKRKDLEANLEDIIEILTEFREGYNVDDEINDLINEEFNQELLNTTFNGHNKRSFKKKDVIECKQKILKQNKNSFQIACEDFDFDKKKLQMFFHKDPKDISEELYKEVFETFFDGFHITKKFLLEKNFDGINLLVNIKEKLSNINDANDFIQHIEMQKFIEMMGEDDE